MSEGATGRVRAGRPARRKHLPLPWLDRGGRFSALKAAVFLAILAPGAVIGTELGLGMMGGRPVQNTILAVGRWVVGFLLMALAITPLRRIAAWPQATTLRRMLGLAALGYALAHLSLYVIDQNFRFGFVASEIANRVYLTIGFVTLLGLSVLGVISTDGWMRRLGRRWKQIQRVVYALGILALLHFFMQSKANVGPATLMAGFFLWLMLWRAMPANWQANAAALLGLAVASAVGTALLEYGWYATATHIPASRVLVANLTFVAGPRPAVWVGIAGAGIALACGLRDGAAWLGSTMARARGMAGNNGDGF